MCRTPTRDFVASGASLNGGPLNERARPSFLFFSLRVYHLLPTCFFFLARAGSINLRDRPAYPIHRVFLNSDRGAVRGDARARARSPRGRDHPTQRGLARRRVSFRAIKELSQWSGKPTVFVVWSRGNDAWVCALPARARGGQTVPLGSAPRRHTAPTWTANALTHFSQATPFLPRLVLSFLLSLFLFFLSFLVCYFLPHPLCISLSLSARCFSVGLFDHPPSPRQHSVLSLCLLYTVSRRSLVAALSTRPSARVPPSGHPFCQAHTSNISCRGPRSAPLPSSCRTNACNCS